MSSILRKAAFLDRDGVLNVEKRYCYRVDDFEWIDGSLQAMAQLQASGYALVVVTNQSGIARGYYTEAQYELLCQYMQSQFKALGLEVAIYHCPHAQAGEGLSLEPSCTCRKPLPGMLLQAQRDLALDLAGSVLVGDKGIDVLAGRAAGVRQAYLVRSGHALSDADEAQADAVFADLRQAAAHICSLPVAVRLGA
jgi:D-glycero-D-manno-heptose 1,7-bisphosphate phosphatase